MKVIDYKIHPFAAIYPMLEPGEMQELADDIKANGLINPIIVMGDVLIDGRNRLAACKLAGVAPQFQEYDETLTDEQVKSLVLSLNNSRRHLTAGQKAMAVAIAYPAAVNTGRAGNGCNLQPLKDVDKGRLSGARKILQFTPANALKVMDGSCPFSTAVTEAQKVEDDAEITREKERTRKSEAAEAARIQKESDGDEDKRLQLMREAQATANANYVIGKIDALAIADPELGDAVRTGALTIQQGEAALDRRQEEATSLRFTAKLELKAIVDFAQKYRKPSSRSLVGEAASLQVTDDYRYAAEFMVGFLNEFVMGNTK